MSQYPIPQFIEQEGKIIYFLTFKQFFLLVGGGGFCLLLYVFLPFIFFVICAIFTMTVVVAIAFVKVDNAPITTVFLNYLGFLTKTKTYTWRKKESAYPFKSYQHQEIKNIGPKEDLGVSKIQTGKLKEVKKIVDTKKF